MLDVAATSNEGYSMHLRLESPGQADVRQLIEDLDAYQTALYPPESHHGLEVAALMQPNVLFAVARSAEGVALGCGAIVLRAEYGEVKRMFVTPSARGSGIGRRLLAFLEDHARARGCVRFRLETGNLQDEALSLYTSSGYTRCDPFGSYRADPNSVFMCKDVA